MTTLRYNIKEQEIQVNSDVLRAITILDLHLSPVTPISRKDDFLQSTIDAFKQAVAFAVKIDAKFIILAGDIFHIKSGSRNPHWFMKVVIREFKDAIAQGIDIIGIAGNHDLTYGSLVSLENQPIGVLMEAGGMHLLDEKSVIYNLNGFNVRVAGCSYEHAQAAPVRDLKKNGADFLVVTGHFWFGKETGSFFGEPVYGPEFFKESEADAFVIGHHHADQGIPVVDNKTFFVHGSINRIGAHAGDLQRRPSVGLMEITKEGITGKIVRLKVPDSSEIFDLEQHKAVLEEKKDLDEFLNLISNQVIGNTDTSAILKELDLAPEVRIRVNKYLELAEGQG